MGITLHYKGKLKSVDLVPAMKQELIDIAESKNWHYTIVDPEDQFYLGEEDEEDESEEDEPGSSDKKDAPLPLSGLMLGADDAEPLYLTFLPDGRLISPLLAVFGRKDIEAFLAEDEYYAFTKTQNSGSEIHVEYVRLLKYISGKYFMEWNCKDDSEYYETGDEEHLVETMDMINNTMSALEDAFSEHGHNLNHANPDEVKDFISSVLGVDNIEIKMVGATIDENGIEIIDEDSYLKLLLSEDNDDDDNEEDDQDLESQKGGNKDEDDLDLNELLGLDTPS